VISRAAALVAPATYAAEPASIDAHAHVFVRSQPMAIDARYRPNYDASWQTLLAQAERTASAAP
jgi:hypothetical protein